MTKSDNEAIEDFNKYVNMTAEELEEWLKSDPSTSSGWGKEDGSGETVGHDSGRQIVEILKSNPDKDPSKYTPDQITHIHKVSAYCARHLAQESHMKDEKSEEELRGTKSYKSLKNWGHDSLKGEGEGGSGKGKGQEEKDDEEESASKGKGKGKGKGKASEEELEDDENREAAMKAHDKGSDDDDDEEEDDESGGIVAGKRKRKERKVSANEVQDDPEYDSEEDEDFSPGEEDEEEGEGGDDDDEDEDDDEEDEEEEDDEDGPARKKTKTD